MRYNHPRMTLRRKMALQIATMIVGLLLVSGAALRGLHGLWRDLGIALHGYEELRSVYEIGSHLATARTLLSEPAPDAARAANEVDAAVNRTGLPSNQAQARLDAAGIPQQLRQTRDALRGEVPIDPSDALNETIADLGAAASAIRRDIQMSEESAGQRISRTTYSLALISGAVVIGAILIGSWQHRGVIRPLNRLSAGVKRIAAGRFAERVETQREVQEFALLANDFNRMAAELDGLYRELERKVAEKSKELIRSERLASVGYLAAGVAHEINNPLGIIAGYAELALQNPKDSASFEKALGIIREEAFRCKEITAKLLSLARPGDEARGPVNLPAMAQQVAAIVSGVKPFADRKVTVTPPPGSEASAELTVAGVEAELRQVMTNLLLNALESVEPNVGRVDVTIIRRDDWVELAISDNGRGMSPQTVERVFEPFFTEKLQAEYSSSGPRRHGTGLGLSITLAIVESHKGRIHAQSDGPAQGSRFVVELPAYDSASQFSAGETRHDGGDLERVERV